MGLKTLLLYVLWTAGLLAAAWMGSSMSLGIGVGVVFLAAVPIWVAYAHSSAIRRQHSLNQVIVPRWWHQLFEGHLLRVPLLLAGSLWFGIEVLADILETPADAVAWVLIAAGLGAALTESFTRRLTNYKPCYRASKALRLSVPLAGFIAALLWLLAHAGDLAGNAAHYAGTSLLVKEISDTGGLWDAVQTDLAKYLPRWAVMVLRFVSATGYYSLVALAAGGLGLLGSGEWRRIYVFGSELPTAIPRSGQFMTSLLFTVAVAIVVSVAVQTEHYLQATIVDREPNTGPEYPGFPKRPSEIRQVVEREGVGGLVCRVGTINALELTDRELQDVVQKNVQLIEARTDVLFNAMRSAVPAFLDWYYSLTADYLRTLHTLGGDGAEYLNHQLTKHLTPVDTGDSVAAIYDEITRIRSDFLNKRLAILSACDRKESLPDPSAVTIVAQYDASAGLSTVTRLGALLAGGSHFKARVSGSALAGVAAGAVVAKAGVSSSFKLAGKVLVKMAGKKATSFFGGMVAGAGIGAAGGSVVPGAGTGTGAIVGGIAGGVAIMVGVDFLSLKLEEEINRDKFEAELMAAIDDAEHGFKAMLLGQ